MGSKGCIGCGCAAVVILLLILGGLGWWGYSYMSSNGLDWDEMIKSMTGSGSNDDNDNDEGNNGDNPGGYNFGGDNFDGNNPDGDSFDGEEGSQAGNGSRKLSMSEVADQNGFPYVTYDERPKEGPIYINESGNTTVRFNFVRFKNDNSIGVMIVNDMGAGQTFTFRMASCGHSIYHMTDPNNASMDGYVFVHRGGKRILVSDATSPIEFTLGY
jgi:hypothetical protein